MIRRVSVLCLSLWSGFLLFYLFCFPAQTQGLKVLFMQVSGTIDLGMVPYTSRVLREAEKQGAAAVILQINTPGGRVDAATRMRDALLDAQVETIAFIDKEAYSAGALIALACKKIYMTGGGVIGAAAPVTASGEPLGEKYISALRKLFRATAEHHGRPPEVAEAMVDADVAIAGLIDTGKLLTLTTQEALQWHVADGQIETLDALLRHLNFPATSLTNAPLNWAEALVRVLTQPLVSTLVLMAGLLALWVELMEPGFGVGAVVGLLCLALFFGSHYLVGLAGWEEVLLIGVGALLLAGEILLIPGFGIAGFLGVLALVAGLYLSFLGSYPTPAEIWNAGFRMLTVVVVVAIGIGVMLVFLPHTPLWARLSLKTRLAKGSGQSQGPEIPPPAPLLGAEGMTLTPLLPSGTGLFQGRRLDIISEGEYISVDTPVMIVHIEGNRLVVRSGRRQET